MSYQLSFLLDNEPESEDDAASSTDTYRNEPLSITELTQHIKARFERDLLLQNVSVEGEIGTLSRASSGHIYFTLKDTNAQIKGVMWRSSAERLSFTPEAGDLVVVRGQVTVYEARGEYQLYARTMRPAGTGDLYAQFERLKAQLAEEGLFAEELKQPLPLFPVRIGVVTSSQAAAFHDVLNVLRRRYPVAEVILSPTLVQGNEAPTMIVNALQALYEQDDVDVILLVRGGGSIEDLWAFNDEHVVRTVAASPLPLITGVGHEIDFTLVDFASDFRAPTPSAAAEVATPEVNNLRLAVDELTMRAIEAIQQKTSLSRRELTTAQHTLSLLSPATHIQLLQQQVQHTTQQMQQRIQHHLNVMKQQLATTNATLAAGNPDAILSRGYAIVTHDDNKPLTDADHIEIDDVVTIRLHDGRLKARVEGKS